MQESEKCLNSIQVNYVYHYSDAIMGTMASQITNLMIVYSTVYSGACQRKHQSSASPAFVGGRGDSPVTGEFSTQRASNAENVPFDDVIMMLLCGVTRYPILSIRRLYSGIKFEQVEQDWTGCQSFKKKRSLFCGHKPWLVPSLN